VAHEQVGVVVLVYFYLEYITVWHFRFKVENDYCRPIHMMCAY